MIDAPSNRRVPDYSGGGLVNLVAELELRLTGEAASPGLAPPLASTIPDAATYVLVLIDGLGDHQLTTHPSAATLVNDRKGALDASFSTQTSVATATLATGLPPSRHGLISYLLRLRPGSAPVNTLWWFPIDGSAFDLELGAVLPAPNVAERLVAHGGETVVVEPAAFLGSPLDRVVFRGTRARGVDDPATIADTTLEEAAVPRRLVVCYLPYVDAAGHSFGTHSPEYATAVAQVTEIWTAMATGLPDHAALLGTADHGMVDVRPENHVRIEAPSELTLSGDNRIVYVYGDPGTAARLAAALPATWEPITDASLWGPGPYHPDLAARLPDGLLIADDGVALQYAGNDTQLVGYHGGLTEAELRIPLLVAGPGT
jgi:hypothetical protein